MTTTPDTLPPAVAKAEAALATAIAALEAQRQDLAAARAAVTTALDSGNRAQVAKAEQVVTDMGLDERIKRRAAERAEADLLAARRGALGAGPSGTRVTAL